MKILVSGSHGLIGSALVPVLERQGHIIYRLVRSAGVASGEREIAWDPDTGKIDGPSLQPMEAAVHLAGETIASRWTEAKKKKIYDSRVKGTRLLADALAANAAALQTFVSASAIGFYGDRGEESLTEESAKGRGFLAEVCEAWENAAHPLQQKNVRVVHLRFGVVLSARGGALAQMLTPFKAGVGGKVGNGRQYMSWITVDDAASAVAYALKTPSLTGPVNTVSPQPLTNVEFTKALGKALSRPTIFPLPAFAARAAFGQMADELLLASTRVSSQKLTSNGFQFQFGEINGALRHVVSVS